MDEINADFIKELNERLKFKIGYDPMIENGRKKIAIQGDYIIKYGKISDLNKKSLNTVASKNQNIIVEFKVPYDKDYSNSELIESEIKKFRTELEKNFPNLKYDLRLVYQKSEKDIISENEAKDLRGINEKLEKELNCPVYMGDKNEEFQSYPIEEVIKANKKLGNICDNIKTATKFDKNGNKIPLSPFEKYMMAYVCVTQFIYNEVDDIKNCMDSRNYVPILNGDKIVCVGYVDLLKHICDNVFENDEVKIIPQRVSLSGKVNGIHEICLCQIHDKEKNINGVFVCDPTSDARTKEQSNMLAHFCLPCNDIFHATDSKYIPFMNSILGYYANSIDDPTFSDYKFRINRKNSRDIDDYIRKEAKNELNKAYGYDKNYASDIDEFSNKVDIALEDLEKILNKKQVTDEEFDEFRKLMDSTPISFKTMQESLNAINSDKNPNIQKIFVEMINNSILAQYYFDMKNTKNCFSQVLKNKYLSNFDSVIDKNLQDMLAKIEYLTPQLEGYDSPDSIDDPNLKKACDEFQVLEDEITKYLDLKLENPDDNKTLLNILKNPTSESLDKIANNEELYLKLVNLIFTESDDGQYTIDNKNLNLFKVLNEVLQIKNEKAKQQQPNDD